MQPVRLLIPQLSPKVAALFQSSPPSLLLTQLVALKPPQTQRKRRRFLLSMRSTFSSPWSKDKISAPVYQTQSGSIGVNGPGGDLGLGPWPKGVGDRMMHRCVQEHSLPSPSNVLPGSGQCSSTWLLPALRWALSRPEIWSTERPAVSKPSPCLCQCCKLFSKYTKDICPVRALMNVTHGIRKDLGKAGTQDGIPLLCTIILSAPG